MESANIIAAAVAQWRNSTALQSIPIRSTRIDTSIPGTPAPFPYCVVESKVMRHKFSSGNYRVTWYLVTFTVYVGNTKTLLNIIGNAIASLFDRNIGLPVLDNCYVLEAQAVAEDPELDRDDYYGADVNVLKQPYKIMLNETISAVNATLAT